MEIKNSKEALRRAIKIVGSQEKLAEKLGMEIEKATGGKVTRYELRPDFFEEIKKGA